ncbi:ribonucleoside-triphosphate reductase [Acrasis kona]|uniref:Ribonucleoside-triphosphate reductase n=1 Tax=Acrasis kona TaxID=1008807 RepID=A0AAW2Z6L8_9EUKA
MGTPLTEKKGMYAALNNCAFVSTENIRDSPSKPFVFLMDLSMLGVGVGFDTKGAGSIKILGPDTSKQPIVHQIADSREGWVESVKALLDSYFDKTAPVVFDYSLIRPVGQPIKGFGGVSSGPASLQRLHNDITQVLIRGNVLTVTCIVDIMNYIGRCIVAGNIRQTAEIAFGDPNSEEFINLKNYDINPHRAPYGWTSNNSIFARIGMDYSSVTEAIIKNGEPGFAWLQNMRQYSRLQDPIDNKDERARGGNPCLEQTLESFEMCCLVETFPMNNENLNDYLETLKYAFLYAKTVTLANTHWPESNGVMLRNRRVGCSMSGVAQFISRDGLDELRNWCQKGYDAIQKYDSIFSDSFVVPKSIKTTSVKPSGTVSLLAGATPGMHYPESRFYIRRLRLSCRSVLVDVLRDANYPLEPAVDDPTNTVVAEFPIDAGKGVRVVKEVSMWEQLSLASFLQRYWADNQVSCTVTFDPKTEGPQIQHALDYFQYQLKGISFLPRFDMGQKKAYPQMPYEEIDEEEYQRRKASLKQLQFQSGEEPSPDKFCDMDSCQIKPPAATQIEMTDH